MAMIESKPRATSDPEARKQVLKEIEKHKVEYVLFWFTDLEGHLKSFAITPGEIEAALDDGMGFDGSSITGFNAIEESDMVAIPDPETFQIMPPREGEAVVGRMICDIVTPDGTPYEGDPRFVLRRALERMQCMGFDTFNVGPELEYFLFKDNKGTETLDEGGYFAMTALDAATELRNETIKALEAMGIPIEYHHHEVAPSQHEIDMRYAPALDMADHTITYRLIVKEIAAKNGVLRDLHAEAALRRERLGHAHAHVALHRRPQPVLRRERPAPPLADGEGVHRRPAPPRARDVGRVRAVGELLQAARARATRRPSTSPGRSGTAPRSSGSRSTSRARSRRRAPRSAAPTRRATPTSPSRPCCTRASRGSSRATSSTSRWTRTSTTSPPTSGTSAGSSRSRHARRGDRGVLPARS